MKKTLLIAIMSLCMSLGSLAGEPQKMGIFNHLGAGIEIGTTGIGFEIAAPCTEYLQFRAGMAIMPSFNVKTFGFDISNIEGWKEAKSNFQYMIDNKDNFSQSDQELIQTIKERNYISIDASGSVNTQAKVTLGTNFKFLVDFFPMKKSSFHITAGFYAGNTSVCDLYTIDSEDKLEAITFYNDHLANTTKKTLDGSWSHTFDAPVTMIIGGDGTNKTNVLKPNGRQLSGYMQVNGFKPYVGVGFGRAVPKKTRLAFACDLGVQFWGTPTTYINQSDGAHKITTDGLGDNNGGEVIRNLSKITVYPCLNFRLTGRIF